MKVEGSNITINDSVYNRLTIVPKGACEQDSYSGKNLFDVGTIPTQTQAGVLFKPVYENGLLQYVNANGTATSTIFYQLKKVTLPAGNYIINGTLNSDLNNCVIGLNFGSGRIYSSGSGQSFTLGAQATATESFIRVENGVTLDNFKIYPMIRLASVTDGTYEPYTNGASPNPDYPQDIRVVTGDNEVVVSNSTNIFNNKEYANANTSYFGYSDTNGLTIKQADNREIRDTNITINVTAGDVLYVKCNNNVSLTIVEYTLPDNYKTQVTKTNGESFTVASNVIKIRIKIAITSGTYPQNIGFIYLSSKLYEEQKAILHLGTNYLAGIGDYKDEIVGKTDDWKITRKIKTRTYNGAESWGYNSPNQCFYFGQSDYISTGFVPYSNYFKGQNVSYLAALNNKCISYCSGNVNQLLVKYLNIEQTSTAFKTWLSTHNLIAYYVLKTETEETITDTTLITDLNNMYQAMGYDGTTNITITSDTSNAQMTAEVTYTSESDMCEKLLFIFNKMKDKLYHIIRSL